MKITPDQLRAWYAHRQGLDGSLATASASKVLETAGWARSVGGASPYLTLFSRARISRESADAAVTACEIHELPSARGCTYVLPACDFALGLRASQSFWANGELRTALKLGVTEKEIDKLCDAVLQALAKQGEFDPDALRNAVGPASRSLGEEGKKKGLSTTLPLALGKLQAFGRIRRVSSNGRLDNQRYRYKAWDAAPLTLTDAEVATELARRYFRWTGPATLAEFQWFSGLGVKAAKSAIEPLQLASMDDRFLFEEDLEKLAAFRAPKDPQYALVGNIDSVLLLRRDTLGLPDKSARALMDLPSHAILHRGSLVGLWEFDPEAGEIAWTSFIKKNKALESAVRETEAYVKEQLSDYRSFSLDSPKSRIPRIEALRAAK